jgi:hypothetical protein
MKLHYWITKTGRVIFPLPAAKKQELIEKGVIFEERGIADYKVVGKKIVIELEQKEEA